jgi:hypothetical protein
MTTLELYKDAEQEAETYLNHWKCSTFKKFLDLYDKELTQDNKKKVERWLMVLIGKLDCSFLPWDGVISELQLLLPNYKNSYADIITGVINHKLNKPYEEFYQKARNAGNPYASYFLAFMCPYYFDKYGFYEKSLNDSDEEKFFKYLSEASVVVPDCYRQLGSVYYAQKKFSEALECYLKYYDSDLLWESEKTTVLVRLSLMYLNGQGEKNEAKACKYFLILTNKYKNRYASYIDIMADDFDKLHYLSIKTFERYDQLESDNKRLLEENEKLKTEVLFQPDGDGYKECKTNYEQKIEKLIDYSQYFEHDIPKTMTSYVNEIGDRIIFPTEAKQFVGRTDVIIKNDIEYKVVTSEMDIKNFYLITVKTHKKEKAMAFYSDREETCLAHHHYLAQVEIHGEDLEKYTVPTFIKTVMIKKQ